MQRVMANLQVTLLKEYLKILVTGVPLQELIVGLRVSDLIFGMVDPDFSPLLNRLVHGKP